MAKKIGKILKYLVFAFILFITCLLIWRMCAYSNTPDEMEALAWNSSTAAAYEEYGEAMQLLELNMPDKYRVAPDGKFSVRAVYYLPEAKQLQLTVCYNDSTLKELDEKFGPSWDLDFILTDDEDRAYFGVCTGTAGQGVYNYARFVYDTVDLSELKEIALTVRLSGSTEQYSAVAVYHSDIPSTPKKLTPADLAGYEEFK